MEAIKDGREACAKCLDVVKLHEDKLRLGLTKVPAKLSSVLRSMI